MIVLYTCAARNVNLKLDVGCLQLTIEAGYLANLDPEEILRNITEKVSRGEPLTDTEVMQLIVLPLTRRKKKIQRRLLKEVVDLAKQVEEWISMTKVARLYEEKRLAAVALVREQLEKEKEEAVKQLEEEKKEAIRERKEAVKRLEEENQEAALKLMAMKWIIKGRTPQEAARESGLSVEEVEELLR